MQFMLSKRHILTAGMAAILSLGVLSTSGTSAEAQSWGGNTGRVK